MPIWLSISFALMAGGTLMFALTATPGNFGSLWWLTLTLAGLISFPSVSLKIAVWIEEKNNRYSEWKHKDDSPVTTELCEHGEKK